MHKQTINQTINQDVRNKRLGESRAMRHSSILTLSPLSLSLAASSGSNGGDAGGGGDHLQDIRASTSTGSKAVATAAALAAGNNRLQGLFGVGGGAAASASAIDAKGGAKGVGGAGGGASSSSAAAVGKIASWVVAAPDDLAKCIVEHQYAPAVALVLRVRVYVDSVKGIISSSSSSGPSIAADGSLSLGEIVRRVEERSAHLASALVRSVSELPNSNVWGAEEQKTRLRLLISLGQHALAAQGFSSSQVDIVRRVMRDVEASGDPRSYTTAISKLFFSSLGKACSTFLG